MSRKNLLAGLGADAPARGEPPAVASGAIPVAHLGKMLGAIRDRSERAERIEKALEAGDRIVEIAPDLIDPSPIADRLPAAPEADAGLKDSIAEHGQRVPVLLRINPNQAGRFLTIYGHRRIAAVRELGGKVRAIVVEIGEEEAYVAQGVENAERKDLSFIERALFARRLTDAGIPGKSVAAALGTARPNIVTMVTLCRRLPDDLITAIGPSPTLGRRRWEDLDARLSAMGQGAGKRWRATIASPDFAALDVERRFAAVLTALAGKATAEGAHAATEFRDEAGTRFGTMEKTRAGEARLKFAPDRNVSFRQDGAPFSDWLAERISELRAAWRRGE